MNTKKKLKVQFLKKSTNKENDKNFSNNGKTTLKTKRAQPLNKDKTDLNAEQTAIETSIAKKSQSLPLENMSNLRLKEKIETAEGWKRRQIS